MARYTERLSFNPSLITRVVRVIVEEGGGGLRNRTREFLGRKEREWRQLAKISELREEERRSVMNERLEYATSRQVDKVWTTSSCPRGFYNTYVCVSSYKARVR